ncbi:MAG: hemerythrin family protein [Spirochaetes bacterium]|uniref:Hemerythrin family protein n=1 Tax=Candidatus Avitreponema avistercoris TaxID=2840705 RepID=A0A9D9EP16_9SPIR|nr:hemerythrin family protein [Candidatus Avitreponema avistercoris]
MNQQSNLLIWDKKFELGIPAIDAQHEHLVELCNNLYQSIIRQKDAGAEGWQVALSEALRETAGYIVIHFRDEEKLLKAAGYANFAPHRQRHQEFIAKTTETITNFDKATFQTAFDFVKFLYDWILRHIAYEDKLYVKTVLEFSRQRAAQG